jgi:hypothetical protein
MRHRLLLGMLLLTPACLRIGPAPPRGLLAVEQQAWWDRLRTLCGRTLPGRLMEQGSADDRYRTEPLAARVTRCAADTVDIAFDVGGERTRTWQVTRESAGLRLRHFHSDAAGTAESPTGYGGSTVTRGTAQRQDFPADSATMRMLPPAARNVWSLEIAPGRAVAYTLARVGSNRRFRVEFAIPAPR